MRSADKCDFHYAFFPYAIRNPTAEPSGLVLFIGSIGFRNYRLTFLFGLFNLFNFDKFIHLLDFGVGEGDMSLRIVKFQFYPFFNIYKII